MATLRDRFNALFRSRVGRYDSQAIPNELGIWGTTAAGANINETTAMGIATVYACAYKIASSIAGLGLEIFVARIAGDGLAHPYLCLEYSIGEVRSRDLPFFLHDLHSFIIQ